MPRERLYAYWKDSVGHISRLPNKADASDHDLPSIFGISTVKLGDDGTEALAKSEVALGKSVIDGSPDHTATLGKVRITLTKSAKSKCARCWKHRADDEDLCQRCATVTSS